MPTALLSGASGFIGSALAESLTADGHRVVRLTRTGRSSEDAISWDPAAGQIDTAALERLRPDMVFNLAGEPIAQRWTARRKRDIRDSRVHGTAALARALAGLATRPAVLVSSSGMNYYGVRRGDDLLTESDPSGPGFLAGVCAEWEAATAPAAEAGIRVAVVRTGLVLGRDGGALPPMLIPFRFGVGGPVGDGQHWMSWISLTDAVRVFRFLAESSSLAGPVNMATTNPVRNAEFARTVGQVLHRPAWFPVPAFAIRLALGEMGRETVLADLRMVPKRLAGAGFEFRHPQLDHALAVELRR